MLRRFVSAVVLGALVALLATSEPVDAQNAVVVASCPASRASGYTVGTQVLLTVDQNGNLCSQATSAGAGSAVTVADGADVAEGTTADAACASDNGTCTVIALLKRENQRLTSLITALGTPFQAGGAIAALPTGTNSIGAVTAGVGITPTDRTIASTSGASQQLAAALATRKSLTIVNTGNANCGVNPTGGTAAIGAAGTLTLAPLGSYTPRVPTLSAVTVICTAGQPIYADES